MPTAEERVAAGAALLDTKVPGWRDRIDMDILDLDSTVCCIIGQLSDRGFYAYAYEVLGLGHSLWHTQDIVDACKPVGFWPDNNWHDAADLDDAWRALLAADDA